MEALPEVDGEEGRSAGKESCHALAAVGMEPVPPWPPGEGQELAPSGECAHLRAQPADSLREAPAAPARAAHRGTPADLAAVAVPPTVLSCLGGSFQLEVSVHSLSPALRREAAAVFPDAPPGGPGLACLAFQFAAGGLSLAPDASSATLHQASLPCPALPSLAIC